jgi:polar amino acid transport system ATP-binding protein
MTITSPDAVRAADLALDLQGVSKRFGQNVVLDGVNLSVKMGEVVVIMGPSGGGKSTLLRCINFLETPDAGRVWVAGEQVGFTLDGKSNRQSAGELRKHRARIGMVFQRFNLFAHLSALDNVAFGPRMVLKQSKAEARTRAEQLLSRVHMSEHSHKFPHQLSGGQQQRVAIARALAMNPVLLLLDEPTSALDPELVGEVLSVVGEIARGGMTMVIATHEMSFARAAADRVIFMEEGRFVEENPPQLMFTQPREERTRRFLSRILREDDADATR